MNRRARACWRQPLVPVALSAALFCATRPASADPQWNTGLTVAGCWEQNDRSVFGFCGGARGDVLWLRNRNSDYGVGPYLEVGTARFNDLRLSGGVSVLLPVTEDFPLVASAGLLT